MASRRTEAVLERGPEQRKEGAKPAAAAPKVQPQAATGAASGVDRLLAFDDRMRGAASESELQSLAVNDLLKVVKARQVTELSESHRARRTYPTATAAVLPAGPKTAW